MKNNTRIDIADPIQTNYFDILFNEKVYKGTIEQMSKKQAKHFFLNNIEYKNNKN